MTDRKPRSFQLIVGAAPLLASLLGCAGRHRHQPSPPIPGPGAKDHQAVGAGHGTTATKEVGAAPVDHSAMGHGVPAPAGERHAGHASGSRGDAVDRSEMGHTALAAAVREAVSVQPGAPVSTLEPDALDRPAAAALQDAARSGSMGHMHGGVRYQQTDADRVPDQKASGHGSPSSAPGQAHQVDPHEGHAGHGPPKPSPRPEREQ